MKRFFISLLFFFIICSSVFAASDSFLKRLKICNTYETSYKNSKTGTMLKKGVLGVFTQQNTLKQSCVYYVQTAPESYNLCHIPITSLNEDKPIEASSDCRITDAEGLKKAKYDLGSNTYLLQKTIINRLNGI